MRYGDMIAYIEAKKQETDEELDKFQIESLSRKLVQTGVEMLATRLIDELCIIWKGDNK